MFLNNWKDGTSEDVFRDYDCNPFADELLQVLDSLERE